MDSIEMLMEQIVVEISAVLRDSTLDKNESRLIVIKIVKAAITALLLDILTLAEEHPDREEGANIAAKDFKRTRLMLAADIADSFAKVLSDFSGEDVEYHCDINIVKKSSPTTH